jgi:hypothetical protein
MLLGDRDVQIYELHKQVQALLAQLKATALPETPPDDA